MSRVVSVDDCDCCGEDYATYIDGEGEVKVTSCACLRAECPRCQAEVKAEIADDER